MNDIDIQHKHKTNIQQQHHTNKTNDESNKNNDHNPPSRVRKTKQQQIATITTHIYNNHKNKRKETMNTNDKKQNTKAGDTRANKQPAGLRCLALRVPLHWL